MPNRIIKESICTSDTIDGLAWFQECFFYRLMVNCDDYGRFDARPAILKARLFPLKDITQKQIDDAVNTLRTAGMIDLYIVDDRPYLQLRTWDKHQQIRAHKSKFPEPKCGNYLADDSRCNQMQSDVTVIQSNPNPNPNPNPNTVDEPPNLWSTQFQEFWSLYPRKIGKGAAEKAWIKIKPSAELYQVIIDAVMRAKKSKEWLKESGQYIPNPATWLNQSRWEDELTEAEHANESNPYNFKPSTGFKSANDV